MPLPSQSQTPFVHPSPLPLTLHHHGISFILIINLHFPVSITVTVTVFLNPPLHGRALRLVAHLPVQRLTRARAVVNGAANGAPTELVLPRLGPPAPHVRAQPETWTRLAAPSREPLRHELAGRVRRRRRHVAAEIAEQRTGSSRRRRCGGGGAGDVAVAGEWVPREPRAGGEGSGEFAGVGLDEETAALGDVLADAVAVLEAVAQLAEGVDVAEEGSSGAEGHAGSEVLVVLRTAAAVELNHRQGVERRRVRINRRLGH